MNKKNLFSTVLVAVMVVGLATISVPVFAQGQVIAEDLKEKSISELLTRAWEASSQSNYSRLNQIVSSALGLYEQEALLQAAGLLALPDRGEVNNFKTMNELATILFVRAEAYMHEGKPDQAISEFNDLIKIYPYAQSWDPSRGAFWSIAEKSQESVNRLTGVEDVIVASVAPQTCPVLARPGTEKIIDYTKYGTFTGVGTKDFKFMPGNPNALARVVGEGIYPNTADAIMNPRYKEAVRQRRLEGTHWDYVNTPDLEAAYFKWATALEDPGVKLYFTALILEKAELYLEAIKAYHALIVQFPRTVSWTYWKTAWYPAQAAISKIKNILRQHPELGLEFKHAKIEVLNSTDHDQKNDVLLIAPGELVKADPRVKRSRKSLGRAERILGGKRTKIVQYANGHWQMLVNNRPFIIKGITYAPTKVGQSPDKNTIENWMTQDRNKNGRLDSPYDSWVDANGNNIQDADEPVVGDFQLLKDMGANVLRMYHHPDILQKAALSGLYKDYGIMVIIGDFLGKYAIGSGATWAEGTDYANAEHQANMMRNIEEMVLEFKDEPYVLFWLLGNENNYGVASNADKNPKAYYEFVNQVALKIKTLDPTRPVAICSGDTVQMDLLAKYAPAVDIYGGNVYRGDYGFGSFWNEVRRTLDKPAFITEYGSPAYVMGRDPSVGEKAQASYHDGNWADIMANAAGEEDGEGNALGGVAFEWLDEWWKNYEPSLHDVKVDAQGPFADGYYHEEWFGLVGQGDGKNSPYMRQLRQVYYMYQKAWRK